MQKSSLEVCVRGFISLLGSGDARAKNALCFIACHSRYLSSDKLLEIVSREIKSGSEPLKAIRFLTEWVRMRFPDFRGREMLRRVCRIALHERLNEPNRELPLRDGLNRLKLTLLAASKQHRQEGRFTLPKLPLAENQIVLFMRGNSNAIAQQMRYVNAVVFSRVRLTELQQNVFSTRCSRISVWAASCILAQKSYEKQTQVARKIIEVANFCKELGDYASFWSLMQGFLHHSVNRIKSHWELGEAFQALAGRFIVLLAPENNYQNYRREIEQQISSGKACLPHLYTYQKDLALVEQGNPDVLPGGGLNYEKLTLLSRILQTITDLQNRLGGVMANVQTVPDYLIVLPHMSDEKLDARSLELKPKPGLDTVSRDSRDSRSFSVNDDSTYADITEGSRVELLGV